MFKRFKEIYNNAQLASKIRYSYLLLVIPMLALVLGEFHTVWVSNNRYEEMIDSMVVASDFSLDFKKDYDYETYLVIVGARPVKESGINSMLSEAGRIIGQLEKLNTTKDNVKRIKNARRFVENLKSYNASIEANIAEGNKYEENMEIWENDVQIVTTLLRENIFQYIYYETRDLEQARDEYRDYYLKMISVSIVSFMVIMVLVLAFSYYIPRSITQPISRLSEVTNQVAQGDLDVRSDVVSGGEVGVLSDSLNTMIDKINELLLQVTQEQIHLRESELELLQSQINPHFLYNTLDTIVWLAETGDEKKVVSMVQSLSEFFRTSLSKGKDILTIKEELVHARSYLEIQQVRYSDILEYEIDVPEELTKYLIPKMTIQPLVENALYHGIKNKRGLGKIKISANTDGEYIFVLIEDNGKGMDEERLREVMDGINAKAPNSSKIYGLYNVNERIELKFGPKYGISLKSIPDEGTVATIRLPLKFQP